MTVLVCYASARGSTRGVAERIGARLRAQGVGAEVRPMAPGLDAGAYDGFVLGSAIHEGRWLPEAAEWLRASRRALASGPVWLFSVSTLGDASSMFRPKIADQLRAMRRQAPEVLGCRACLRPRGHRNFAGVLRPDDWPSTGRLIFMGMGGQFGDHRDWADIDSWARGIATALHPAASRPAEDGPWARSRDRTR